MPLIPKSARGNRSVQLSGPERLFQNGSRPTIVGVRKRRQQDDFVADVEVCVTGRQTLPIAHNLLWHRHLVDVETRKRRILISGYRVVVPSSSAWFESAIDDRPPSVKPAR